MNHFIDLTDSLFGYLAILIFFVGYYFVIAEDRTHLAKSKPMMVAAGLIWLLVGLGYTLNGQPEQAGQLLEHTLLEYAELFLFLLSAMTFIHALEERHLFLALRSWLIARDFSLRTVFWVTGGLTFILSPIADNLSTALLMGSVVMAVGTRTATFVVLGLINVVVAANAGGVFSPFGDITSLMVWQQEKLKFLEFTHLIIPALIGWLIPALVLNHFLPTGPSQLPHEQQSIKPGAVGILLLFLATITASVLMHSLLKLPPVIGMMTGLGILKIYGYLLSKRDPLLQESELRGHHMSASTKHLKGDHGEVVMRFDNFRVVERASWDTLMFFYGVVFSVGGLAALGYLTLISTSLYGSFGETTTHLIIGLSSSLIDNIPVMYAILSMDIPMSTEQWLLATLCIGLGGSILSIGSAAGVAMMGQANGIYTFKAHLKWSWVIILGYALSAGYHIVFIL